MANKLTIVGVFVFIAIFIYLLVVSKSLFDAAWLSAIFSVPCSSVADYFSRFFSITFGIEDKKLLLDFIFILLFGCFQYGIIGYILGLIIDKFLKLL